MTVISQVHENLIERSPGALTPREKAQRQRQRRRSASPRRTPRSGKSKHQMDTWTQFSITPGSPFRRLARKRRPCAKISDPPSAVYGFLVATKQLYEWYFLSVRLSVRLSVHLSVTPFWLCSHHCIIMKFSGVITKDQGNVHAKGQGQRSEVWIHIWWWNDTYSLMLLRRGALLIFKVIRQISRSHGAKNCRIWPRLGVSGL